MAETAILPDQSEQSEAAEQLQDWLLENCPETLEQTRTAIAEITAGLGDGLTFDQQLIEMTQLEGIFIGNANDVKGSVVFARLSELVGIQLKEDVPFGILGEDQSLLSPLTFDMLKASLMAVEILLLRPLQTASGINITVMDQLIR